MARPAATTFGAPMREMIRPATKDGPYMARTCHWIPRLASAWDSPQRRMASGAEVISQFMMK